MSLFQTVWLYCLNQPALVVNGLALFYALSGSWLVFAAQWQSGQGRSQITAGGMGSLDTQDAVPGCHVYRMFSRIGLGCLALAVLLSLLSTLV
ncbi:MAG: hypothetical protein ACJAXR_000193 [Halopseudomonas sp.]|jgi:hypothetical protein